MTKTKRYTESLYRKISVKLYTELSVSAFNISSGLPRLLCMRLPSWGNGVRRETRNLAETNALREGVDNYIFVFGHEGIITLRFLA